MQADADLKTVTQRICVTMDKIGTTTDGIQVFVNHWGRWVAKIIRKKDEKVFHAFGNTMLEALSSLETEIQKV